jgi:hypothetical protein
VHTPCFAHLRAERSGSRGVWRGRASAPELQEAVLEVEDAEQQPRREVQTRDIVTLERLWQRTVDERERMGQSEMGVGEDAEKRGTSARDKQGNSRHMAAVGQARERSRWARGTRSGV